jgi:hypothetical protein
MSHTSDATVGDGGTFDPQQAATLLDQSTRQARRQLWPGQPMLWVYRAVMVLVAFGAFWLSVRGQQPYTGPTAPAIAVTAALVAVNVGWSAFMVKRAASGIRGPAQRAWRIWGGITLAVLVVSYTAITPAYQAGTSHPAWGLYLANGPLLITGLVGAVASAALRDRFIAGPLLAMAAIAAVAGFAGPVGAWLVMGIGLCAVCLATAAFRARQQRSGLVRS